MCVCICVCVCVCVCICVCVFFSIAGHADIVTFLLAEGLSISDETTTGDSAAHLASWKGHRSVLEALVKAGADLNKKNKEGKTPADVSAVHSFL